MNSISKDKGMVVALLGLGTVGGGVQEIIAGLDGVRIKTILGRMKKAPCTTDDICDIVGDSEVDLVIETMGGLHPAYEYARAAIEAGKHFVTANKLLVSVYGRELVSLAREKGVAFLYGAACGGGIAYLANLRIARSVDRISALGGILNGTTNFILDAMQSGGGSYADALHTAQELGYAERDPSSDVDGLDTQRKLILACAVGLDAYVSAEDIPTAGIASILAEDVAWARAHGYVLRLCAHAERRLDGSLSAYVEPTLLASGAPEAAVHSNVNYAWYRGESCGLMSYIGQGAGRLPTASNVVRDVRSIAAGATYMTDEACAEVLPDNSRTSHAYYVRIPMGEAFPAEWVASCEEAGGWVQILTHPVSVEAMHAAMAGRKGCFLAGVQG